MQDDNHSLRPLLNEAGGILIAFAMILIVPLVILL